MRHGSPLVIVGFVALALFVLPATSFAQLPSFEAEVDCGGTYAPGDPITLTFRLENQTLQTLNLSLESKVLVPGLGEFRTVTGQTTLGPNQNRSANKTVIIRSGAPNGSYTVTFTADSGTEVSFDTCSFKVE